LGYNFTNMNINIKKSLFKSISFVLIASFLITIAIGLFGLLFVSDNSTELMITRYQKVLYGIIDYLPLYSMILIGVTLIVHTIMDLITKKSNDSDHKRLTLFEFLIIATFVVGFALTTYTSYFWYKNNGFQELGESINGWYPIYTLLALYLLSLLKLLFHFFKKEI
jgi:hypothetical protein